MMANSEDFKLWMVAVLVLLMLLHMLELATIMRMVLKNDDGDDDELND